MSRVHNRGAHWKILEAEQLYTYPFLNWTKVTWPTPPSTEQQLPANKLGLMLG